MVCVPETDVLHVHLVPLRPTHRYASLFRRLFEQYSNETGQTIVTHYSHVDDHITWRQVTEDLRSRASVVDVYMFKSFALADLMTDARDTYTRESSLLLDMTSHVAQDPDLMWPDISYFFKHASGAFDGRLYHMVFDADVMVPLWNPDVVRAFNYSQPATVDELLSTVRGLRALPAFANGTLMAVCARQGNARQTRQVAMSLLAPFFQTHLSGQGFLFDVATFAPAYSTAAFSEVMQMVREILGYTPDMQTWSPLAIRRHSGAAKGGRRCAFDIGYGSTMRDAPRRRMTPMKLGSSRVLDWATGRLVPCTAERCPHAERLPSGRYVNHAPFAAFIGHGWSINRFSSNPTGALQFVSHMMRPAVMWDMVSDADSGCEPVRVSHLSRDWFHGGAALAEDRRTFAWLVSHRNIVPDFTFRSAPEYFELSVRYIHEYCTHRVPTTTEFAALLLADTEALTERLGRALQVDVYRKTLQLPPLARSWERALEPWPGTVLLGATALGVAACAGLLWRARPQAPFRHASGSLLNAAVLLSSACSLASMSLMLWQPAEWCAVRHVLIGTSVTAPLAMMTARLYRLDRIYNCTLLYVHNNGIMTNTHLLLFVLAACAVDIGVGAAAAALGHDAPVQVWLSASEYFWACPRPEFFLLLGAGKAMLASWALVLVARVRHVPAQYNSSAATGAYVFGTIATCFVWFVGTWDAEYALYVPVAMLCAMCATMLACTVVPLAVAVGRWREADSKSRAAPIPAPTLGSTGQQQVAVLHERTYPRPASGAIAQVAAPNHDLGD